jgi:hypothetical protein
MNMLKELFFRCVKDKHFSWSSIDFVIEYGSRADSIVRMEDLQGG